MTVKPSQYINDLTSWITTGAGPCEGSRHRFFFMGATDGIFIPSVGDVSENKKGTLDLGTFFIFRD